MTAEILQLDAVTKQVLPYVQYSMRHFLPETVLMAGFILAIIIDLVTKRSSEKKITGYFAIVVLAVAGYLSYQQWIPYVQGQSWKSGSVIFPYSQSFFGPQFDPATKEIHAVYGMSVVDNFAVFFKMLIALTGILIAAMSLMSREVKERSRRNGEYFSLLLALSLGMFLMPASTDLIMMYISLELVSITSYIMSGFMKDSHRSTEASMKYVLYGAFSSGLMIYGFSILYGLTGTTNIVAMSQVLATGIQAGTINQIALWTALILSLAGFGYKISAAPFHFWTPDVYEGAPIPVTALLSVASKAGGFGLLMRFLLFAIPVNPKTMLPLVDWTIVIAIMAAITMTLGNFAALRQSNLKRLLAYSTIAHAGYMMVGLVAAAAGVQVLGQGRGASDPGIVSILMYFIAYLFMNLGAFYVVMLIANRIGSEEVEDYKGLAKKSPLLAVSLSIFLISLTGIPLTIGFIGKLYIFSAIVQQPKWLWLTVVMVLNSVVSLYYYVRVMQAMFVKQANDAEPATGALTVSSDGTLSYSLGAKMFIFAFLVPTIVFGIYFSPLVDFSQNVIRFFNIQ
jgi:NADH-quinone oxidoreductase subunit N